MHPMPVLQADKSKGVTGLALIIQRMFQTAMTSLRKEKASLLFPQASNMQEVHRPTVVVVEILITPAAAAVATIRLGEMEDKVINLVERALC